MTTCAFCRAVRRLMPLMGLACIVLVVVIILMDRQATYDAGFADGLERASINKESKPCP